MPLLFSFINDYVGTANVAKRRPFFVLPVLANFGRFGAFSRQNGPTDRPAAERPVKRKFGKNNRTTGQWSFGNPEYPRGGQKRFLNGRKRIFEKLSTFFW